MIPKLQSLKLLKEEEIVRTYKEITIEEIPEKCQAISIDVGRSGETKLTHKVKYFTKEIESDED